MALNIREGQRVTVWEIEDKGNYSIVQMSSSRKDKRTGTGTEVGGNTNSPTPEKTSKLQVTSGRTLNRHRWVG